MDISATTWVLIGVVLGGWTLAALAAIYLASRATAQVRDARTGLKRLQRMLDESPALPLLVRADGRIEASPRLAGWLGLEELPTYLAELGETDRGLSPPQAEQLQEAVRRTQKTAAPFDMMITPQGSLRSLSLRGQLADPQVSPGGAALVWVFDFSDSESELARLRDEAQRARGDFAALVGLLEAAPMPMWFRTNEGDIRLVNSAYVVAVGAKDADEVVAEQIELVEPVNGLAASHVAREASQQSLPIERMVNATIDGQRRALRVSDLPLGEEGIAGYAIDVEDMEELSRSFKAFRLAQRNMLDKLSAGVAQFDANHHLIFANRPFQRSFGLTFEQMREQPSFSRWLENARDRDRIPQVRDYPAWRKEREEWFTSNETNEESWTLADGTHLRIFAQPNPDGGLLLLAEDQTEQLQLSASQDTLLRTRTATFDSLFESIAVFRPDGRLQLWNRRFAADWGLDEEFLDTHPRIDELLGLIQKKLKRGDKAGQIGDVVRAATLDRAQGVGRANLSDGRILEFAGVPLPDGNGLLTVLDITDTQKAEEALRARNAALVEADAMKTRFLANMSYEFRTPLTSMRGFAELLETGIGGELTEDGMAYLKAILDSVEQVESVLDLSQSEAGMLPLVKEEIALAPFLENLIETRRERIDGQDIQLELKVVGSGARIMGDDARFSRAVGHILDNAINALPEGGRILVKLLDRKDGTRIVISDDGEGMDAITLARALDGLMVSADGKTVERRVNYGLPLAKRIVEAHGGNLEVMSEKGQGTAVIFDLG